MLILFWVILNQCLNYFVKNDKITRMLVSTIHACSIIFAYLGSFQASNLSYWSATYYLTDTYYELSESFKLYQLGLLLHHSLAILNVLYLNDPIVAPYMFYIFYLAELSNLPMYLWYYLSHNGYKNTKLLNSIVALEALFYIVFRLGIGSYTAYQYLFISEVPLFLNISSGVMLIISIIWTLKLIKQLIL